MFRALLYLRLTSLRNMVAFRIRRMRQPKYLIGTVFAVLYLYYFLVRRQSMGASGAGPVLAGAASISTAFLCGGAAAVFLIRIAFAWISPPENAGLRFSEAEISFLFPAPVTRRMLIHFRLVSAQIAILVTSALIVLFFRRFGSPGGSRVLHVIGWWVILSTFDLHLNGTNLTLVRLKEIGRGYLLWRMAAVAVILLYAGAVVLSAAAYINAHAVGSAVGVSEMRFAGEMADSAPLRWLILPFRLVFAPYFAGDLLEFGAAIVPALAILGLHYYWVSSTEARFEEGSIAMAEKRAATKAALLRGESPRIGAFRPKAQPGPFPLAAEGPPEVAFLWKNLLSVRSSLVNRRGLIRMGIVFLSVSFALRSMLAKHAHSNGTDVYGPVIAFFFTLIAGYALFIGPQLARQDLRNDLPNMDLLKTYPVEGWRIALGELLAPAAILTLILWLCILVCAFAVDTAGSVEWLTPGLRVVVALCLGVIAPVMCLLQLIVPNSILVLLPGWHEASRSRGGGIELMGQRMILSFGQMILSLLVAAPAAGAAALVIFSTHLWFGIAGSVIVAMVPVLAIMGGEAAVGVWWLGGRFERFDLSAESK